MATKTARNDDEARPDQKTLPGVVYEDRRFGEDYTLDRLPTQSQQTGFERPVPQVRRGYAHRKRR